MQPELKYRFGLQVNLLALGHGLHSSACARTYARSNGSTLSSAGESANQCSYRRSAADGFRRPLPTRGSLFRVFVCLHLVALAVDAQCYQHQGNLRSPGKVPRTLEFQHFALDIRILGNDHSPSGEYRRVQRRMEGVAILVAVCVNRINETDRKWRA